MNEKTNHEFKIHLDDGGVEPEDTGKPSPDKKAGSGKKQEKKSGGTVPWIPYALITVVVAAMIAGYYNIRSQLLSVHSFGSRETRHLSENLESKFTEISSKFSNLETSFTQLSETQTSHGNSLSSLTDKLSKTEKLVSNIDSSKADKKSLSSSLAEIKKELSALTEALNKNSADMAVMSSKLKATLLEVDSAVNKVLEEQKTFVITLEGIKSEKASKKDLISEIDHLENVLKASREQSDIQIAGALQSIQRLDMRINALEVKTGLGGGAESGSVRSDTNTSLGAGAGASPSSVRSQSGDLIERDISH